MEAIAAARIGSVSTRAREILTGKPAVPRFHDDVHIDHMACKGAARPKLAAIPPDLPRPGRGLIPKRRDAELYLAA